MLRLAVYAVVALVAIGALLAGTLPNQPGERRPRRNRRLAAPVRALAPQALLPALLSHFARGLDL
jgi:hypothetical protein